MYVFIDEGLDVTVRFINDRWGFACIVFQNMDLRSRDKELDMTHRDRDFTVIGMQI
jgi:hypothetical protein